MLISLIAEVDDHTTVSVAVLAELEWYHVVASNVEVEVSEVSLSLHAIVPELISKSNEEVKWIVSEGSNLLNTHPVLGIVVTTIPVVWPYLSVTEYWLIWLNEDRIAVGACSGLAEDLWGEVVPADSNSVMSDDSPHSSSLSALKEILVSSVSLITE